MKKSLVKNNLKTIKRTKRRFISILIMAFLGVGFYAGLVASSPDMLDSLDRYADTSNLYDINIISTLGLTDDDINEIKKIDGIESVYGIQTKDSLTKVEDKESICKVIEYNENINIPVVVAGRNIENENECLLDSAIIRTGKGAENYIGKKIVLENEDKDSDNNPIFTVKEFEVVGIAETPIYISGERGNTSIGNGTVSFYIFTQDNVINMDYYTGVYATVKGAKNVVTNSDEYLELVNPVVDKIENIKQTREENRYNELVNKATSKLNEAQKEFDDKKQEVDKQLEDAENKIKKAENEISASEKELKNAENEIQNQEQEANKKFEDYANQIKTGEEELYKQEDNLKIEKENLKGKKLEANSAINQINIQIANLENTLHALELQKLGCEVVAVDKDMERVNGIADSVSYAMQADIGDPEFIRSLGTRNLDAVVIAEAESLEASIMAALECKEIGVPNVIAKAKNNRHATVLKKIGVDTIIFPEKEMGVRLAKNLMSASFTDWIALSPAYSIVETPMPAKWSGKTLKELDVRRNYEVNVVGIKSGAHVEVNPDPLEVLRKDMVLILVGSNTALEAL